MTERPDLAELRRLLSEASAGPWERVKECIYGPLDADEDRACIVDYASNPTNADLIVAMHAALPWLLSVAEAAQEWHVADVYAAFACTSEATADEHEARARLMALVDESQPAPRSRAGDEGSGAQ